VRVGEIYGRAGLWTPDSNMQLDVGGASPTFRITYGNADKLVMDSAGNVGIGTTAPGYKLDVSGDARVTGTLYAGAISGTYTGTINAANVSAGQFGANTGGGDYFFPGYVGIGTTAVEARLHVVGTIKLITPSADRSPCIDARIGTIRFIPGGPGAADTLQICAKDANGNYAWRQLY
jgi:hypothetical protein